uniref:Uncharacterized protein n=1 Tax=Cannabis sativa TaxID=3483 RepID=A0A803NGH0_CANSA
MLNVQEKETTSWTYLGETRPGIGQPSKGEPRVDLGDNSILENLRDMQGQVLMQTNTLHHNLEETRVIVNFAFKQQRREFQEWMDYQTQSMRANKKK